LHLQENNPSDAVKHARRIVPVLFYLPECNLSSGIPVQAWRLATLGCLQSTGSHLDGGLGSGISGQSGITSVKGMKTLRSSSMLHNQRGSKACAGLGVHDVLLLFTTPRTVMQFCLT
jgi:hypothetical protein